MNEPKAFASLSSGLLARKGGAKPAMRPQGFGQMGTSLEDLGWNDMGFEAPKPSVAPQERDADHDAFGQSVTGHPVRNPVAALTPSPVHGQQAALAEQFGAEDEDEDAAEFDEVVEPDVEPVRAGQVLKVAEPEVDARPAQPAVSQPVQSATPSSPLNALPAQRTAGPKAAFTLRLDAARHLRLRLACALTGRSAQMLVTDAVDRLLADYPELEKFAGQLPDGGRSRRTKG